MSEEEKASYTQRMRVWRAKNKDKWNAYQKERYIKKVGGLSRNMNHTPESRAQWARDKSNRRCGRAKQARFTDEFTQFVTSQAHELRKLRNKLTGFEWHVDHTLPLNGKDICGLHIWSNLQVIPKIVNLQKGAKNPLHEERKTGLSS